MAKIIGRPLINGSVTLEITEEEAYALNALVGYGVDPFLKMFYEHMGKAYLEPHEKGLRSLFDSVRGGAGSVSFFLDRLKRAREAFNK
jgi:hypothetical protein